MWVREGTTQHKAKVVVTVGADEVRHQQENAATSPCVLIPWDMTSDRKYVPVTACTAMYSSDGTRLMSMPPTAEIPGMFFSCDPSR